MPVRAKLLARSGDVWEAAALAREAVELTKQGDALNRTAKALTDFGEILVSAGRRGEAQRTFASAMQLYAAKGNVVGARRMRALLGDASLVPETARPA